MTHVPIPSRGHFIWLGKRLSALGWLSMRSALAQGGLSSVVLHHDAADRGDDPLIQALRQHRGFELRRIEATTADDVDPALGADVWRRLEALTARLDRPASRANVLRMQVLWREGGVYLDTDAIVLRDLEPLRRDLGFAGLEHVCLPTAVVDSRNPLRWARAGALLGLRDLASRLPRPSRAFGTIEGLYTLACNNAVLGAAAGHATMAKLLTVASTMPAERALRRFQLGPRLLEAVTANRSTAEFVLHPPAAFYPLGPEICWEYVMDDVAGRLGAAPPGRAYVAHLYDSVLLRRLGAAIDVDWLLQHRERTLLGRMVAPYLDELRDAARGHWGPAAGSA